MADRALDILPLKPFNWLLFNFYPCPVHLLKNTIIVHVLRALERIPTVGLRPHLLQSKKGETTAKLLDSSDEDCAQKPDANL